MNEIKKTDIDDTKDTITYVIPQKSAYSGTVNFWMSVFFLLLAFLIFLPILLVIIISFSSDESVTELGYSFFPKSFSLDSYRYIFHSGAYLFRAFFNSVFITAAGTVMGLLFMCPMAYAVSRKDFGYRKPLLLFLMIPMMFSGGLVSAYMVNTQILHLRNSYPALILPGLCSTWYIMIMRNYFRISIPDSLVEAAELDGCDPFQTFIWVVLPISQPVIVTVSVFQMFSYWSSWYPSLLYLDSNHTELYPLQYVLVNMDKSIERLSRDSQYISGAIGYIPPAVTVRMVMVVIVILPIMILLPFFHRFLKNGMTVGAIKE